MPPNPLTILSPTSPLLSLLNILLTSLLLTLTRSRSPLRLLLSPLQLLLTYHAYATAPGLCPSTVYTSCLAGLSLVLGFQCLSYSLIRRHDRSGIIRETHCSPDLLSTTPAAAALLLSFRGIGTSWQAKNVPRWPTADGAPPRRGHFLASRSAQFLLEYLLLDILTFHPPDPAFFTANFSPSQAPLFSRPPSDPITTTQLLTRLAASLSTWFLSGRLFISCFYTLLSILFVSLHLSTPAAWPPLFGPYRAAGTLRGYWGVFWHQLFRVPFTTLSSLLTRCILHLPYPSVLERYVNLFTVFAISAALHAAMDAPRLRVGESGAWVFFPGMAAGIMIEDAVRALGRRVLGEKGRWWRDVLGYVWVAAVITYLSPFFLYPTMEETVRQGSVLPFSVCKWLVR